MWPFDSGEPITIRDHDHPFKFHDQKGRGSTYECNGCKQPGIEPYYKCTEKSCDVHYHKLCGDLLRPDSSAAAAPVANHDPYPTGLVFEETELCEVRRCAKCVACGDQVRGIRYEVWNERLHSSCNPFWLLFQHLHYRAVHPLCASLPSQIQETGEQHIVLELNERIRGRCSICNGIAKGWAYNSTCGNLCYHVGCRRKKIIQSWQLDEASQNGGMRRKVHIVSKKVGKIWKKHIESTDWKKVGKILKKLLRLGLTIAKSTIRVFFSPSVTREAIIAEALELLELF